ncbi:MAG: carboxypeptidase regulatory-like domain-containing protein, partial [Pyrinomonadaceae bacterium]
MSKTILHSLWIALFLGCFCIGAAAQETTGGIEGSVVDPAGAVVPNITISIANARTSASGTTTTGVGSGFRRTITSNAEGFFRAIQIPPGSYTITTAASAGFGETRYENIAVSIGQVTQLSITVTPGGNVTTVDVAASDLPPVDTTSNAIQTSITAQRIELLPKGTGFTSILKSVPGTRPESRTGGFTVDGASGGENVFVIDGLEVTNYRTGTLNDTFDIPTQLVQEVQVKSSGFEAAYGGATGGVISVVTRGGNNQVHGEFGMQVEDPRLNGDPRQVLTRFTSGTVSAGTFNQFAEYFQPVKATGINYFPTANLSGPIIKDRLWAYGSYSPQFLNTGVDTQYFTNAPAATRTFIASQRYRRETVYEYAFARLDGNPLDNLRLTGTFLW